MEFYIDTEEKVIHVDGEEMINKVFEELERVMPEFDDYDIVAIGDDLDVFLLPVADDKTKPYLLVDPIEYTINWTHEWLN